MGLLATMDRHIQAAKHPWDEFWYRDPLSGFAVGGDGRRVPLSTRAALAESTFWKCVRWRAQMIGMLPKKLKENVTLLGRPAKIDARDHPLFTLLHDAPNPYSSSMDFFQKISHDLDTEGNFFALIQRRPDSAKIQYLWRLRPSPGYVRVETEAIKDAGLYGQPWRLWYYFRDETGEEHKFYPDEILHIRGIHGDGFLGYSPIQFQNPTLRWSLGTSSYGNILYQNANRPSGLVTSPQVIKKPEERELLLKGLDASGKKAGALLLLEGGLTYTKMSMTQEETQFIETKQLLEEDIAGIMNVKPHKIGIMRNMTNNNVEQQNIEAVTDTLQPACTQIEKWCDLQLLSDAPSSGRGGGTERDRYGLEFELKGLLRGDTKAQTEHIEKMIDKGVYSQNDSLEYLSRPPYEGGDRRWMNAAYVPIDKIDEILEKRGPVARERRTDALASSYRHVFRDAAARTIKRSKRDAADLFRPTLEGLAHAMERELNLGQAEAYLSAMQRQCAEWTDADAVASEELDRAITMISNWGPSHA